MKALAIDYKLLPMIVAMNELRTLTGMWLMHSDVIISMRLHDQFIRVYIKPSNWGQI